MIFKAAMIADKVRVSIASSLIRRMKFDLK